jgi:hypothetical protein
MRFTALLHHIYDLNRLRAPYLTLQHRIADRRVMRLIQKWLNAGVLEDGKRLQVEEGTPQGGSHHGAGAWAG